MSINVINKIDWCKASDFPQVKRWGRTVVLLTSCQWQPVCIKIPAKLQITEKKDAGQRIFTAQLNFRTPEEFPRERMVYRATAVNGKQYLVGTSERPYPITTITEVHPDNITDNQLFEVGVTYSSTLNIPYIAQV